MIRGSPFLKAPLCEGGNLAERNGKQPNGMNLWIPAHRLFPSERLPAPVERYMIS